MLWQIEKTRIKKIAVICRVKISCDTLSNLGKVNLCLKKRLEKFIWP